MSIINYVPVFIDTNVLLHAMDLGINIVEDLKTVINKGFEIIIHPMVEAEIIEALMDTGKLGRQARFAMKLMSSFESYYDPREYDGTDICLLISAKRNKGCVFTLDKGLRDRCIAEGVCVISSYKKGKLKLHGYID